MILPTIHSNGTSKERLIEALCNASHAIEDAYQALKETAPNGRDYYPQGYDAIFTAEQEHYDRMKRLNSVKEEVDRLTLAIAEIGE